MDFGPRVLVGALAAAAISALARRVGSLSTSGAIAATVVGTAAVGAGWNWGALLIAYFVSSSLLSRVGRRRKLERTRGMIEKGGPRDATQVMSNGLLFTVLAGAWALLPSRFHGIGEIMCAAAASLAASAADTWGTEIGTWIGQTPRSVLNGRRLPIGQSGGVTAAGLLATLGGALFVAIAAGYLGWRPNMQPTIVIAGVVGALVDSVAGAVAQQRRWCDACASPTEMRTHDCGAPTRLSGGLGFMTNDGVNLLATFVAALIGLFLTPGISD